MFSCSQIWSTTFNNFLLLRFRFNRLWFLFKFLVNLSCQSSPLKSIFTIFSVFNFSLFCLLLFISLHFLFDVFINCILENISTYPYSLNIDTFLKVLNPILFCLLAIYSPKSDWYFLSSLSLILQYYTIIIRFLQPLLKCCMSIILSKQKVFLQRSDTFFQDVKISSLTKLFHKQFSMSLRSPLILFNN